MSRKTWANVGLIALLFTPALLVLVLVRAPAETPKVSDELMGSGVTSSATIDAEVAKLSALMKRDPHHWGGFTETGDLQLHGQSESAETIGVYTVGYSIPEAVKKLRALGITKSVWVEERHYSHAQMEAAAAKVRSAQRHDKNIVAVYTDYWTSTIDVWVKHNNATIHNELSWVGGPPIVIRTAT